MDEELVGTRDPAREGGFSDSSSSEEDSSSEIDSEDDAEAELAEQTAGQEQTEDIPLGDALILSRVNRHFRLLSIPFIFKRVKIVESDQGGAETHATLEQLDQNDDILDVTE